MTKKDEITEKQRKEWKMPKSSFNDMKKKKLMNLLDFKEYEWITDVLNKLDFVKWDRYYWWKEQKPRITIFGWIDRPKDDYKDFIVLEFDTNSQGVYFLSTSSAEYSEKIAKILGSDHMPCERVEDTFECVRCC